MIDRLVSWSQNLTDRLMELFGPVDIVTIDEVFARVQRALEAPQANPVEILLLVTIAFLILLSIVIAATLLYLRIVNRGSYHLTDVNGQTHTVSHVNRSTIAQYMKLTEKDGRDPADSFVVTRRFLIYRLASAVTIFAILWLVVGAVSATDTVCTSCHEPSRHNQELAASGHASALCRDCHESGSMIRSVTADTLPRALHIAAGLSATQTGFYGRVSERACWKCHDEEEVRDRIITSTTRNVRVLHKEPLEAHMRCTHCHTFNESQVQGYADSGMSVCVQCHSGQRASYECSTCHPKRPTNMTAGMTQPATRGIIAGPPPQERCYDCHDPAPCDSCHGLRIPHPVGFDSRPHVDATHQLGMARCMACHRVDSPTGIPPCTDCHTILNGVILAP